MNVSKTGYLQGLPLTDFSQPKTDLNFLLDIFIITLP